MGHLIAGYYSNEFAKLFLEFNLISLACILIGVMLIIMEFNHKASYRLYFFGTLFIIVGMTIRLMSGGSVFMAFVIIVMISLVCIIAYILFTVKNNKAWFIKASTLSVNLEVVNDEKNSYSFLLGLEGDATTDISPHGHISINDINFFVYCVDDRLIKRGQRVQVVDASNDKIYVKSMAVDDTGLA